MTRSAGPGTADIEHGAREHGVRGHGVREHGVREHGFREHGFREHGSGQRDRAPEPGRRRHSARGAILTWSLGIGGLAAYNWWLLVPFKPGLMTSPDELFSNLEVSGQPYATAMQHADLAAGVLLLAAFWVAGHGASAATRLERLAMLVFAAAGAVGGLWPEVCADGVSAVCRHQEYRFELPASQYIHVAAGVVEFAAITVALLSAVRRTWRFRTRPARVYRALTVAALVGYPLLGASYLVDRFGGVMEAVFFAGFTIMVITQLAERTTATAGVAPSRQCCRV